MTSANLTQTEGSAWIPATGIDSTIIGLEMTRRSMDLSPALAGEFSRPGSLSRQRPDAFAAVGRTPDADCELLPSSVPPTGMLGRAAHALTTPRPHDPSSRR
jgi:hypothetical protein